MAVQLSASYLRRSYQLLAKLSPEGMTGEEAFDRASNLVYEWAKRKFSKIFRQMPYKKETMDDKRDGNEIGVLYEPERGRFIFRGVHPDRSVPGRMWITDVQSHKADQDYLFAARLSVASLQSCTEEVPFSRPEFIRLIVENVGLSDVISITGQKRLLSTREEVDSFAAFLEEPDRRMPAVLLTPCSRPEDGPFEGYMMDVEKMSRDLMAVAHVFQITREANEYLTERLGKPWSAFNGAVRTYYPGLSCGESDYYQHPLLTQQSIRLRDSAENGEPNPCMYEIEEYIQNHVVAQRVSWDNLGIPFYLAAHQAHLREQRAASTQSRQELIDSYEEQLDQLQKQCDETLSLADSYAKDCEACCEENEQQRQLIGQLKAQILTLRFQLRETTGEDEDQNVPEDGTYSEIADWVSRYYPDRLVLHPRAVRSLKDACYEDTGLVYKSLKLLATYYYDYRTGLRTYEEVIQACQRIDAGLEERGAATDVAAGMQGETYYVQYCGRKEKLKRHLAKGNSKDRRYCMRIYYFWDDKDQVIVIGDMPHHLANSLT